VPAGDERVRHRGERVAVVERPMAGPDGVERAEFARRSPGVRLVVHDDGEVLLLPDGPQGPGEPTWRLPGGPVFDSLPAFEAVRHGDGSVRDAADEAAARLLRETVGLDPAEPERLFVLDAGPGVEFDLHCYLVERWRPAPREGDPSDATWVGRDEVRRACLDGRVPEARAALALVRWLADEASEGAG
jgi:ADP-ribose pyrophosphatase YjhB (NUDIX family)